MKTHEHDFINAYKIYMMKVYKELAFLKEKANEANGDLMNDGTITQLQKNIKWYKTEALSLNKILDGQKNKLEKEKNNKREMNENIEFLHTNLKEQMKQNKILKAAAEEQKT